ncbi:hypothetical protein Agub_g14031 [Astrephomene gubernaculifera]|uniref:Wax synthase domain-containing protein n=1 Tax=Astrephomene gubernaculifera TaxID=47775 RepID=A0AAD3HSU6_9CHLO|nr:hypothetical protein Agub_g14031 [Astrephomene gubernaculifera]
MMNTSVFQRTWMQFTRLDAEPGPTDWHGRSILDYPLLLTVRCFATGIAIFLAHWSAYVRFVHSVRSTTLRCLLAAASTISYLLCVLYLHPWQPYWIRELSVMLAQLFAWKIADLVLLRREEPLSYGFWGFILYDVLVLRPKALVLPYGSSDNSSCKGQEQLKHGSENESMVGAEATADQLEKKKQRLSKNGSVPATKPNADIASSAGNCTASSGSGGLGLKHRWRAVQAGAPSAVRTSAGSGDPHAEGGYRNSKGDTSCVNSSSRSNACTNGTGAAPAASRVAVPIVADGSSAAAVASPTCHRACGLGSTGTTAAGKVAVARSLLLRLRLAVVVCWRPLVDMFVSYNACEAANAYLMHRPAEDVLAAPLLVQAWLSCCFAAALYFHLSYFFYSMELLWLAGFALAGGLRAERWEPLFRSPHLSESPVDFWNNRWHQAFRWWWTRLVFQPLRAALKRGLDRLEDAPGSGNRHASLWPKQAACWLARRNRRLILAGLPTLAVFGFSAAFHESLLWINFGRPTGEQALFFLFHGLLVIAQRGLEAVRAPAAASTGTRHVSKQPSRAAARSKPSRSKPAAPKMLLFRATAVAARVLRVVLFMGLMSFTSVIFFRPWFRSSYHRELRVLLYGPTGWAVRVWVLGLPAESVRLLW